MTRVQGTVSRETIAVQSDVETSEGAPACLTYHRLVGNYLGNDAFHIRGHFDSAGRLVPEKVVGYGGTQYDRGLGSLKMVRILLDLRRQHRLQVKQDAQAYIFRSTPSGAWEKLGGGLPQPLKPMPYTLLTHPSEPGCIYVGLSNGDIWQSLNQGDQWEQMPLNLKGVHRQIIMLA